MPGTEVLLDAIAAEVEQTIRLALQTGEVRAGRRSGTRLFRCLRVVMVPNAERHPQRTRTLETLREPLYSKGYF